MTALSDALEKTDDSQRIALQWFIHHAGTSVKWSEIQAFSANGARLVTQAKGIYKPAGSIYARSIRETITNEFNYNDNVVERHLNGTWSYPYHQEGNALSPHEEFTNKSLLACQEEGMPIGVLIQAANSPESIYDVIGVALVAGWSSGYFMIEGFSPSGDIRAAGSFSASFTKAKLEAEDFPAEDFDPGAYEDSRMRQMSLVVRRRGQGTFRSAILAAYNSRCAITGYDAAEALDAAHIVPYRGAGFNHVTNGILLRADIHNLFDLGLITVDPLTMKVIVSPQLIASQYGALSACSLGQPTDANLRPSKKALATHKLWSGL